jgi:GNAT superfamily N-acetyltransferase
MAFLKNNCLLLEASKTNLSISKDFDCGDPELTNFFTNQSIHFKSQLFGKTYCFVHKFPPNPIIAAFTISNGSIHLLSLPNNRRKVLNQKVPREKQMRQYPAVLIGRLGLDINYQGKRIGNEILDFIKLWFIDPQNKTGCRYLIVEGLNDEKTITFYTRNGFKPIFSNEIQEAAYYKLSSEKTLKTRLLYFDLILLVEN